MGELPTTMQALIIVLISLIAVCAAGFVENPACSIPVPMPETCDNGICEKHLGETERNCAEDCGSCGDLCCQEWEREGEALREQLCPQDCNYREICKERWSPECAHAIGARSI